LPRIATWMKLRNPGISNDLSVVFILCILQKCPHFDRIVYGTCICDARSKLQARICTRIWRA
jgi:hypothetical protein